MEENKPGLGKVFGEDTRVQVASLAQLPDGNTVLPSSPYNSVCCIWKSTKNATTGAITSSICSAFFISVKGYRGNVLMTAAHCFDTTPNEILNSLTVYIPGNNSISLYKNGSWQRPFHISPQWPGAPKDPEAPWPTQYDYAVFLLPDENYADFGFLVATDEQLLGNAITVSGYPVDKITLSPTGVGVPNMCVAGGMIESVSTQPGQIDHRISMNSGQSGGPLWMWFGNYWQVIGINSAHNPDDTTNRTPNMATRITDAVMKQVFAWANAPYPPSPSPSPSTIVNTLIDPTISPPYNWICKITVAFSIGKELTTTGFMLNLPNYTGTVIVTTADTLFDKNKQRKPISISVTLGDGTKLYPHLDSFFISNDYNYGAIFFPNREAEGFGWFWGADNILSEQIMSMCGYYQRQDLSLYLALNGDRIVGLTGTTITHKFQTTYSQKGSPLWMWQKGYWLVTGMHSSDTEAVRLTYSMMKQIRSWAGLVTDFQLYTKKGMYLRLDGTNVTQWSTNRQGWVNNTAVADDGMTHFDITPFYYPPSIANPDIRSHPHVLCSIYTPNHYLRMDVSNVKVPDDTSVGPGTGVDNGWVDCQFFPPGDSEMVYIESSDPGHAGWTIRSYNTVQRNSPKYGPLTMVYLRFWTNDPDYERVDCTMNQTDLSYAPDRVLLKISPSDPFESKP